MGNVASDPQEQLEIDAVRSSRKWGTEYISYSILLEGVGHDLYASSQKSLELCPGVLPKSEVLDNRGLCEQVSHTRSGLQEFECDIKGT